MFLRLLSTRVKTFLLTFVLLLPVLNALAQLNVPKPVVSALSASTPTATSLGTYGQIPVGYFTGVPQIEVPLYTIKYKDLAIPLSLSYHNANGSKADVMPGLVGLGWTLNAGGSITRMSKELQAEDITANGIAVPVGFNPTSSNNWSSTATLQSYLTDNTYIFNDSAKYDAFYFNFGGNSGYIYFDQNNKAHIKSATSAAYSVQTFFVDNKVIPLAVVQPNGNTPISYAHNHLLYKFILTDNNGIKYTFGGTDESIEFTRPGLPNVMAITAANAGITASSWQLTSIESPNGYKIKLEYRRGTIVVTKSSASSAKVITRSTATGNSSDDLPVVHAYYNTLNNPVYLSKILTPLESVVFTGSNADNQLHFPLNSQAIAGTGNNTDFSSYLDIDNASTENRMPEKLDQFVVYDRDSTQQKKIRFSYTSALNTRLKLLNVKFSGTAVSDSDPYSYAFSYNPLSLPQYLSFRVDHFGYFNNKIDPDSLQHFNHNWSNYYLTREPDSNYAKAELLTKVTYPTKGYTTYDYELNAYSMKVSRWPFTVLANTDSTALLTGGLRIKTISSYDEGGSLLDRKRYYYTKNYANGGTVSSGVLSWSPIYNETLSGNLTAPAYYANNSSTFTGTIQMNRWSTNSLNPMSNTQGSHITYSEVTEKNLDNSYTVYKYKNYDNGYNDVAPLAYVSDHTGIKEFWKEDPGSFLDLERGQLAEQNAYNNLNVRQQRVSFTYNNDPLRFNDYIRVVKKGINSLYTLTKGVLSIRFTASQVFTYYPYLKNKQTVTYLTGGNLTETQTYNYDSQYRLMIANTTIRSNGTVDSVQNLYVNDMIALGQTTPYQDMKNRNLHGTLIRTNQFINNVKRFTVNNYYQLWPAANNYLPVLQTSQLDNNPIDTLVQYDNFDKYGNVLTYSEKRGAKKSFLWSYKGQFPIAEIHNADYNAIKGIKSETSIQSFAEQIPSTQQVTDFLAPLRSSLSQAQIISSSYKPSCGITSMTDIKGLISYYEYDNFGRLRYIFDQNHNIVQSFCYNYAGQLTDCGGIQAINSYNTAYSTNRLEICYSGPPAQQPPLLALTLYTRGTLEPSPLVIGAPIQLIYTNNTLTNVAPNGYYTVGEQGLGHTGPKLYYIENGVVKFTVWCDEPDPATPVPIPGS